ncbi:Fic family protein [Pedobacter xixiisoli]|uniref:Fic/DOC family protein n=1 Tax=Pedobacter xixiisoli TaxID=1476464 RepID=A0A286A7C6_9SPHI|nr:Fic family protein [Pedobacter xixiisoli]SOD17731.1 Fic/DOC family protein [Pedobacter xixiisoli]
MDKNIPLHLQEIIFASSEPEISRAISAFVKDGKLKQLVPKVYTSNLQEAETTIIKRNLFKILGHLYKGAILSHRSAFEYQPTSSGDIFVTHGYDKKVEMHGVTVNFLKGPGALEGDLIFMGELHVSQRARAFLECLQPSRRPGASSKTLTLPEIELKLDQIIRVNGEEGINAIRDKAKEIAPQLGMEKEYAQLDKMIGALLSTKPSNILTSPIAQARAFGSPYDPTRVDLFQHLFVTLQQNEFPERPDPNQTVEAYRNFAFFEAYFSNFIEGTKFKVEEAIKIIESGKPLPTRYEDGHDVLGTYHIVSNRQEMQIVPTTPTELIDIMKYRHKILMSARPEKKPGEFKDVNNRAGATDFVDFNLVKGTLEKGFDYYAALQHPFAKAAFMMFLVSEVHPFLDGNGRIARVMMNAELTSTGQAKIIIPTVYRTDYLGGLRSLTRRNEPEKYIRMLLRAWKFSHTIAGESMEDMQSILEKSNAFEEGEEYILKIVGE